MPVLPTACIHPQLPVSHTASTHTPGHQCNVLPTHTHTHTLQQPMPRIVSTHLPQPPVSCTANTHTLQVPVPRTARTHMIQLPCHTHPPVNCPLPAPCTVEHSRSLSAMHYTISIHRQSNGSPNLHPTAHPNAPLSPILRCDCGQPYHKGCSNDYRIYANTTVDKK